MGKGGLHLLNYTLILLLKHFGKLALSNPSLAVNTVVLYMVDEEQTQHLDALGIKVTLTLNVTFDGLTYLYTTHRVFRYFAHCVSLVQHQAVEEGHSASPSVYLLDHIILFILCQLTTLLVEVEALASQFGELSHRASATQRVEAQASLRVLALLHHNLVEVDIAIGRRATHLTDTLDFDFLDELFVVSIDGIEAKHHVHHLTVRSRIEQREERIEAFQSCACGIAGCLAQYRLWLVDNHDGIGLC